MDDKKMLEVYMWGFNDSLNGKEQFEFPDEMYHRCYELGWVDCIAGDDNPNLDYQSNEEILKRIKK